MRPIRIHLLSACGALFCAQVASAADMPRRYMPPPAPMPAAMPAPAYAPLFSWSGFYIGANLGYGWGKGDGNIAITGIGSGPISGDGNGFLGGLQAGYNWQFGAFVLGAEADIQYSTAKGDVTGSPGAARLTAETKEPYFGTLRGRLGYATGERWLWYMTGGAAFGKSELTGTVSGGGGSFDRSENYWAWTLGAGVETSLWDRWSVKLEYLYIATPSDVPVPPRTASIEGDVTSHIIRTGLNYRF